MLIKKIKSNTIVQYSLTSFNFKYPKIFQIFTRTSEEHASQFFALINFTAAHLDKKKKKNRSKRIKFSSLRKHLCRLTEVQKLQDKG